MVTPKRWHDELRESQAQYLFTTYVSRTKIADMSERAGETHVLLAEHAAIRFAIMNGTGIDNFILHAAEKSLAYSQSMKLG